MRVFRVKLILKYNSQLTRALKFSWIKYCAKECTRVINIYLFFFFVHLYRVTLKGDIVS